MAQALNDKQLIFSGTTAHKGRKTSVFPGNSELRHLHYGRILLDGSVPLVNFQTEARETALLASLMQAGGRCLSGEQLKDSLYGFEQEVGSNAINVHIHHLRRKLGADVIQTVRGLGYRFGRAEP